ncbi:hypothetical protein FAZ15_13825 [Sphingobacterium olei]|uniref:Uncharacterized protein n=1 Tax=Sphingobacterium olei TaxID=2571155 RepID=A0A4U0NYT5_9SPHI|nr:hypothetical protein [Sphingobacterium olei]TJZ59963.1 hypothetical protein FAZ15_13825 [Sphingobacterium olei]
MKYLFLIGLGLLVSHRIYAAPITREENLTFLLEQDTTGKSSRVQETVVQKKEKSGDDKTQTVSAVIKKVPKAKNQAVPKTIGVTSIQINTPKVVPVKVNTQVKIKL